MLVTLLTGGGGESGVGAFPLNIEFGFLGLALVVGDNQSLVVAATILRRNDEGTIDLGGSSLSNQLGRACLFLGLKVELLAILDLVGGERLAILINNLAGFGGHFQGVGVGVQGERPESAIGLACCGVLALETDLEVHRGRLRTAHVGGAEQVVIDFLGVGLFFGATFGKALIVEAGAQVPDSCLGLSNHRFLGNLSRIHASLLEHGFIADSRVAVGGDPVDLLTNILVSLELVAVATREIRPLSSISIIGLLEVYFPFGAVCETFFAACLSGGAEKFGADLVISATTINPVAVLIFIDAEFRTDFLCACSRCYVSCAKK